MILRCVLNDSLILRRSFSLDNTSLQKEFPRSNFPYSVSFSSAEKDYESHFFASHTDVPKFYDKGVKINKISCAYAEFNQQNQHFAYGEGLSRKNFHPCVQF